MSGEQDVVRPVDTSRGESTKTGVAVGKLCGEELQPHTAMGQPRVADIQVEGNPGAKSSFQQASVLLSSERAVLG